MDHAIPALVLVFAASDGLVQLAMCVLLTTMVPLVIIVSTKVISFILLITKYLDCNPTTICHSHGTCDNTTGSCKCDIGWGSSTCGVCAANYYGTSCSTCI